MTYIHAVIHHFFLLFFSLMNVFENVHRLYITLGKRKMLLNLNNNVMMTHVQTFNSNKFNRCLMSRQR